MNWQQQGDDPTTVDFDAERPVDDDAAAPAAGDEFADDEFGGDVPVPLDPPIETPVEDLIEQKLSVPIDDDHDR